MTALEVIFGIVVLLLLNEVHNELMLIRKHLSYFRGMAELRGKDKP